MNIQHNGELIRKLEAADLQSVLAELNEVIQSINEQGQVVQTITIDGEDVTGTMDVYIEANMSEIQTIAIESVTPDEIIEGIYQGTIDYLQRVHQATETISDMFYGKVTEDAWGLLTQLSEGLSFVVQSLQVIAEHRKSQHSDTALLDEVAWFVQAVEAQVTEINQAIQDHDTVAVGDIIRYELGSAVTKILSALNSRVQ